MKKILYPLIGFAILCISFFSSDKKAEEKRIEDLGSDKLILRPFHMFGLLWSCSPGNSDEDAHVASEPTHYSEMVDSITNSENHSSHYSGTHSSHYSGTHQSHQSHSSHSSHYSAR